MWRRTVAALAVALVLIGLPASTLRPPAGEPRGDPPATGAGLITDAQPIPAGSQVSPVPSGEGFPIALTLAFSNSSRLASALAAVSSPSSPDYRHYLTYSEFEREFGPSPSEVDAVERALRAVGAESIALAPARTAVAAILTPPELSSLLGVRPVSVVEPVGVAGYSVEGTPVLPTALDGLVVGVGGLSDLSSTTVAAPGVGELLRSTVTSEVPVEYIENASTDQDWFVGSDFTTAYEATELLPTTSTHVPGATFPTDDAIATLLVSGYNTSHLETLPPWSWSVVDSYFNATFPSSGWPLPSLHGVPVNLSITGFDAPPAPGPFNGLNDSTGYTVENALDLEMAGSMAPGAPLYNFYFNASVLNFPRTAGGVYAYLSDELGDALSYDYAPAHLTVVSCSFGLLDTGAYAEWDNDLELAAMMGVTVVAATGDQGDAPSSETGRSEPVAPLWPATVAFNTSGVVAVGGETIGLSGTPSGTYSSNPLVVAYDSSVEGLATTTAWWNTDGGPGNYAGTEGGTSVNYPEPSWQFQSAADWPIVNASEREGDTVLGRGEPDVGFVANSTVCFVSGNSPESGIYANVSGTKVTAYVVEGTSIAAPVFAGLLADVVAVENATSTSGPVTGLGFLDPALYAMADFYWENRSAVGSDPFDEVPSGHNALFTASAGWDPLTGWGSLVAPRFLAADENATITSYTYTGPTPGLATGSGAHSPLLPFTVLVTVIAVAVVAILLACYVLLAARRRQPPRSWSGASTYYGAPPAWDDAPAVPRPYATFFCPFCGAERPAEPGHCPSCGAM